MKKYLIPLVAMAMLFSAYKMEKIDEENLKNIQVSNEVVLQADLQSLEYSCEETIF